MSYETAPATQLVATCCAACSKPLVDAASLAAGMGPECRKKYGVTSLDEATRTQANLHIYQIALHQDGPEAAEHLSSLRALGLTELADRIVKRLAPQYTAMMADEGARFSVRAAYDVAMGANLGLIAGRRWDKERKCNTFPQSSKRAVFNALCRAFPNRRCLGPKGEFRLNTPRHEQARKAEAERFDEEVLLEMEAERAAERANERYWEERGSWGSDDY